MNLWLLVPVKPLGEGKSRLAGRLSPVERAELSSRLLAGVLSAARAAGVLAGILVISRDAAVLAQAAAAGATPVMEIASGLNPALGQAREAAVVSGADAILVLPADLPLVIPQDVRALHQLGAGEPGVVVAPSRAGGTNALLLRPPMAIDFAFGPGSCERHCVLARAAELPLRVFDSPTLAFDVDLPEDLGMVAFTLKAG